MCGCETPYDETTHIDLRENYVIGSGQCCSKCVKPRTSAVLNADYSKTILGNDIVIVNYQDIISRSNNFELGSFVRHLYDIAKNGK